MSLTLALQNALSGLNTSQAALQVISNNVANVNTEGYSRKITTPTSRVIDVTGAGVELSEISRVVDERLLLDMRRNLSSLGTAQTRASYYSRIQDQFGSPGDNSSISNTLTDFSTALQSLSATPESSTLQTQAVSAAVSVAKQLNKLSAEIQFMRLDADKEIAAKIQFVNGQLQIIADLNQKIERETALGQTVPELEDARDLALNKLSGMIEANYFKRSTGEVVVVLPDGRVLADKQAATLSHTPAGGMGPTISYAGGSIDGIWHNGVDFTNSIPGGEIKGLIEMRDSVLPNLQAEIDRLTEVLRNEINALHNAGTSLPAANSLTGTRSFTAPTTDTISTTAGVRIAVVDQAGNFVSYFDLAAGSYTVKDIEVAIDTNLAGFASSTSGVNSPLSIQATSATNGIAIVDLGDQTVTHTDGTTTYKGFSNYFGLNDLFVTAGNVQGDSPSGISQLIAVRGDIVSNHALFSRGALNSSTAAPLPLAGEPGIAPGDNSVIQKLADKFLEKLSFTPAGGLSLSNTTLAGYAAEILSANSVAASVVEDDVGFRTTLSQELSFRNSSISAVNLDEELSNMILYQNTYAATARIITMVDELFDILTNIVR
jgi:flagellar hook-associated protein 1 FlgK